VAKRVAAEVLIDLRRRLDRFSPRDPERGRLIAATAELHGVSRATLYRQLRENHRPRTVHRADRGQPRAMPMATLERYCELVAALKIRTENRKGHRLSTARAIELLEQHGVETPDGLVLAPAGLLRRSTVDRHLALWSIDHDRLARPPAAVRFEARHSNALWQFDLSPSDLKQVEVPSWVEPGRGSPTLMLYSIVDDRSGLCYQEYRCVYGEDVEAALRFLFAAMSPKAEPGLGLEGIPEALYLDNGPIGKSRLFRSVMDQLGIEVMTHMPAGSDGRRPTARAKGKVERAFRTVKEAHETLYHFHKPASEEEANRWLHRFLVQYNAQPHRAGGGSRLDDWHANLPDAGLRVMCSWERYCAFAREPERRKVGSDARVTVEGVVYQLDPELAGETVVLWWGLFDRDLYVEHRDERQGPYRPLGAPVSLERFRRHRKTRREEKAERIDALARRIGLPRTALSGEEAGLLADAGRSLSPVARRPFEGLDPFDEPVFPSPIAAKRAIADTFGTPLGRLAPEQRAAIDTILRETLERRAVLARVRRVFAGDDGEESPCSAR
jgi:hypothetical protein